MTVANGKPVMITTEHRGVFGGLLESQDADGKRVTLTEWHACLYWSEAMRGFSGLATIGPDKDCKIGPRGVRIDILKVTAITEMTPAAWENWRKAPWAK